MFGLTDKILSYVAGAACLVLAIALFFTHGALNKAERRADKAEVALATEKTGRAEDRTKVSEASAKAMDALRSQQSQIATKYQGALNEARKQADFHRRDAAAARAESDGMREQTLFAARQLADAATPASAIREYAIAANELLDQCSRRYQSVAQAADGHSSDVKTLISAWPSVASMADLPTPKPE